MASPPRPAPGSLDDMVRAVALVRERLTRATVAFQESQIDYAVIGANAVAFWVATKDEGAVRNTPNVDVLIEPHAWSSARSALEGIGLVLAGEEDCPRSFLDGPNGKLRQAVRLWFAGDVLSATSEPLPSLVHSLPTSPYRVPDLPSLIRMKLSAWRIIDRVHLHDMTNVGLIDESWPDKFPEVLAERLRQILANPDG